MTPEFWINLQTRYDLDVAERTMRHKIEREVEPRTALDATPIDSDFHIWLATHPLLAAQSSARDREGKMTQEEAWYFRHNGFHRVARPLPRKLVARLNAVTDEQIATLAEPVVWETGTTSRTPQDVRRLSKILARDPVYLEAATHRSYSMPSRACSATTSNC